MDNQAVLDRLNSFMEHHDSKDKRNQRVKLVRDRFKIAGTKDKRGLTTQLVTAKYLTVDKLKAAVRRAFANRGNESNSKV